MFWHNIMCSSSIYSRWCWIWWPKKIVWECCLKGCDLNATAHACMPVWIMLNLFRYNKEIKHEQIKRKCNSFQGIPICSLVYAAMLKGVLDLWTFWSVQYDSKSKMMVSQVGDRVTYVWLEKWAWNRRNGAYQYWSCEAENI